MYKYPKLQEHTPSVYYFTKNPESISTYFYLFKKMIEKLKKIESVRIEVSNITVSNIIVAGFYFLHCIKLPKQIKCKLSVKDTINALRFNINLIPK